MMKIKFLTPYILLFLMSCYGSQFSAQSIAPMDVEKKNAVLQEIEKASQNIQNLQCNFIQEKTSELVVEKAIVKGVMFYESPAMLRWEYTNPIATTLILNDKNAVLLDKNGKTIGNASAFKQLGNIIVSMINGNGLQQHKQFSSEIFDVNKDQIRIVLTPSQKRLKDYYQSVEIVMNKKTFLASEIHMNEKSGDRMVILLQNSRINEYIDPIKFEIK